MLALIYLRWSDLYGEKIPFQTIRKKLRRLKRGSLISNLTAINTLFFQLEQFGRVDNDLPALQNLLNRSYLRESIILDIQRTKNQNRPVFNRLVTSFLAQQSLIDCSEEADILTDGETEGGFELGDCILMLNDYLFSQKEQTDIEFGSTSKIKRHLGFQLAPNFDFSNPLQTYSGIVRSEIIYTEILKSEELKEILIEQQLSHFDIEGEFKKATKISIIDYIDITLAILFIYMEGKEDNNARYITPSGFLKYSILDLEILKSYLKLESGTPTKFLKAFKNRTKFKKPFSFTPLKTTSIVEILNDVYLCIDPTFLSEKLNSGVYWKLFDSLNTKKRDTFFPFFGYVFELYVRRILKQIASTKSISDKKGLLLSSPVYKNKDKVFDEIIYFPDSKHLVVVETKSSFLHTEAKYGTSIRKFEDEIKKKFIAKDDDTGKGIGQLANHIGNLFCKDRAKRLHLENNEFDSYIQKAEKVSPVLIIQEPILRFHIIEEFLNENLKKRLKNANIRESININQLTVIDIETLEILKPYLIDGKPTLEQCINSRAYRDSEYKQQFYSFLRQNFDELKQNKVDAESEEIFERVFGRIKEKFFGDESNYNKKQS